MERMKTYMQHCLPDIQVTTQFAWKKIREGTPKYIPNKTKHALEFGCSSGYRPHLRAFKGN